MRLIAVVGMILCIWAQHAQAGFDTLLAAARMGDLDLVKAELAAGTDPNPPSWHESYAPLMFAAGDGHAEMTRLLLAAGANPGYRDHNQDRALLWAAQNGHPDTVAMLLAAGDPPDSDGDPYGNTPLMEASRYGRERVVELLLAAGADPTRRGQSDDTALHEAALSRSAAVVRLLLQAGADPNAADSILGETPLHIAAVYDSPDVVRLLIDAGADVSTRNRDGETPILLAAQRGQTEAVRLLLAAGADPDIASEHFGSALIAAMSQVEPYGDPAGTALLLAEHTRLLDPALSTAVWSGFDQAAYRLLERGADANAVDEIGRPALAGAALHPGMAMFETLLAAGADLATHGPAALLAAASHGHIAMASRLLDLGVPVDAADDSGTTALLMAAASGEVAMVELLLGNGANPAPVDALGRGPAEYMEFQPSLIESRIEFREASRAYRPTDEMHLDLEALRCRHEQIRPLLSLPSLGPDCAARNE